MATNRFITNYSHGETQSLAEDLIIEAIKIHGVDIQYLPRTVFNEDKLFGEDPASLFSLAVPVEVYVNNLNGFEGEGDFLSKFGLEIRDSLKLTIARKRWNQIRTEKLIDEDGYVYQDESANTSAWANSFGYLLETASSNGYSISSERPLEGDLVFVPFVNRTGAIFEVKHVEHEKLFYPFGTLYTWELSCDLFKYASERLDTGNTQIDAIETKYTMDMLSWNLLAEDGTNLLDEDGSFLIVEFRLETTAFTANNEWIRQKAEVYVNWSEQSPFGEDEA